MHNSLLLKCTVAAALVPFLSAAPAALGAGAHTHGEAALSVAIDGPTVTLDFEGPLHDLAGFEHAPRTEKQKQAVAAMAARLREPARLFMLDPAARCEFVSATLAPPVFDKPDAPAKNESSGEHKDQQAQYLFRCGSASQLRFIDVTLFDAFPRIKRINASVAGVARQSAMTLTPAKRRLAWQ